MKLDDKHILILLTVWNVAHFGGLPPSVADLQKTVLLSAGGVQLKIKDLVEGGYIVRKRLARSITLTQKGIDLLKSQGLINENNSSGHKG